MKTGHTIIVFFILGVMFSCKNDSSFSANQDSKNKKKTAAKTEEITIDNTSQTVDPSVGDPESEIAVESPVEENPFIDPKTNKCRLGHRLYLQICCWHVAGIQNDSFSQPCHTLKGPVQDVCDNACDNGICNWHLTREGFSICVKEKLDPCPTDWRIKGVRNCTLDNLSNSDPQSTAPLSEEECPMRHKLYTQDCILSNGSEQHGVFNPTQEPCVNYCNESNYCPHMPNGEVGTICSEDELKDCPSNWKTASILNCYLP